MGHKAVKHVKVGKSSDINQHVSAMEKEGYTYLGEATVTKQVSKSTKKEHRRLKFEKK